MEEGFWFYSSFIYTFIILYTYALRTYGQTRMFRNHRLDILGIIPLSPICRKVRLKVVVIICL